MKRIVELVAAVCLLVSAESLFAQGVEDKPSQFSISLGLGAGVHSAPSLVDYISTFGTTGSGKRLDEFSSMLELYIAPSLRVDEGWGVALEYGLLVKTQQVGIASPAEAEFTYNVHMPTAIVHYVVDGQSYYVKFGGGVGYHFATLQQTLRSYGAEEHFSAEGLGVKLEAMGYTKFDETFYGNIGADLRWDFLGSFKNSSGLTAFDRITNTTANMRFFSVSLKFGVAFHL